LGSQGDTYVFGDYSGSAQFGGRNLSISPSQQATYLAKYTPQGSAEWVRQISSVGQAVALAVDKAFTPASPDLVYLVAQPTRAPQRGVGLSDAVVVAIDQEGNAIRSVQLNGEGTQVSVSAVLAQRGLGPLVGGSYAGGSLPIGTFVLPGDATSSTFAAQFGPPDGTTFVTARVTSTTATLSTSLASTSSSTSYTSSSTTQATTSTSAQTTSASTSLATTASASTTATAAGGTCNPEFRGCDGICYSAKEFDLCGVCDGSNACNSKTINPLSLANFLLVSCKYRLCDPCIVDGSCLCGSTAPLLYANN
jgi:hypothetical protein